MEPFGTLRSLLHTHDTRVDRAWRERLLTHLQRAHIQDPDDYEAQWLPYLSDHLLTHDAEFVARSLAHLERLATLLPPEARITLSVRPWRAEDARKYANSPSIGRVTHLHIHGNYRFEMDTLDALLDSPLSANLRGLSLHGIDSRALSAPSLAHTSSLEHLTLHDLWCDTDVIEQLGRLDALRHLRSLHLEDLNLRTTWLRALLDSSLFEHLEEFETSYSARPDDLGVLATHPALSTLTSLGIALHKVSPRRLEQLLASPYLEDLRALSLDLKGKAGARTARALADRPPGLERLALRRVGFHKGYEGLASSRGLSRCTHLTIEDDTCPDVMLAALARNQSLDGLQHLRLSQVRIDTACKARDLLADPSFTHLHTLELRQAAFRAKSADAFIAHLDRLPRLRALYLDENRGIGDREVIALSELPTLPALERLSLARDPISDEGAAALARCERLANLHELDLRECPVQEQGIRALLDSPWLERLDRLRIHVTDMARDNGSLTRAILESGKTRGLERVTTRQIALDQENFAAILDTPEVAGAFVLDLSHAALDPDSISALFSSPHMQGVRELVLNGTTITLDIARQIADSPHLSHISSLSLKHTDIDDEILTILLTSRYLSDLVHLNLQGNTFGERAARAIAECAALWSLESLFLNYEQLPHDYRHTLEESPVLPRHIKARWTL